MSLIFGGDISRRRWIEAIYVLLLLAILGTELGLSVRRLSRTLDEANHIQAGYRYWQCGDFGVNPEHPPLAKLVATIPLNFDRPKNPGLPCASYDTGKSPDNVNGINFLSSNNEGRMLAETRTFVATFDL